MRRDRISPTALARAPAKPTERRQDPARRTASFDHPVGVTLERRALCSYNKPVIEWDERKRAKNLAKHGLDFADSGQVHGSPAKVTFESARQGEPRRLDLAYVEDVLLAFVYVERANSVRAISLRRASRAERRMYEKAVEKEPN